MPNLSSKFSVFQRGWTCESGIGRANLELDVRGWACESGIGRANPKELQASFKVFFENPQEAERTVNATDVVLIHDGHARQPKSERDWERGPWGILQRL